MQGLGWGASSRGTVVRFGEVIQGVLHSMRRRLGFITAIPQSVHRGSGCYVGIGTLAAGATALGNHVEMIMPTIRIGSFLVERYLYQLRHSDCAAMIDLDQMAAI